MATVPFHYVDLRTFCYATEDEKRVEEALRTFMPERDPPIDVDRQETEGFHGDRILVLSTRLEKAEEIRHVLSVLADCNDLDTVVAELEERVDENCSLFIHLDKQAAFKGEAALGEGISLRAKVEAYPAKKDTALANAREALDALLV